MPKFTRKKAIAVATTALVLGISGTAYAYWTQSGTGSGTGTTGTTTSPVTVTQTSTVAGLYPGGAAQALSGTLSNPNASEVKVGAITVSGIVAVKAVGVTGTCDPLWYSVTGTGAATNPLLAGGTTSAPWSGLNVALSNNAVNQDACKGATITITYSVAAAA